jgi:hypothetical protein
MNPSIIPSERAPLVGVIDPQSATTAKSTGWIKCDQSILFTLLVGALATSATVDAKVEEAKDASGTSPQDIAGKAITQLTEAGSDDNKQVQINVHQSELDVADGYTHVRLTVTPAVDAALIAATAHAFDSRYQPAADAATVDEVVR